MKDFFQEARSQTIICYKISTKLIADIIDKLIGAFIIDGSSILVFK